MRPTWDDLQLYEIDLHIHVGTERPEGYAASDFIDFAVATGRRIIGATDHFAFFLERFQRRTRHYPANLDGSRAFARDVGETKEAHPEVIVLFGPEIGVGLLGEDDAEEAFSVPEIDYFIAECGGPGDGQSLGEYLEDGVANIAKLTKRFGCPGILGHPLRWPIGKYVGRTGQGFEMPRHGPFPRSTPTRIPDSTSRSSWI